MLVRTPLIVCPILFVPSDLGKALSSGEDDMSGPKYVFAAHGAQTSLFSAEYPALHMQSVLEILPASDVALDPHAVHSRMPVTDIMLNFPASHCSHVSVAHPNPALHKQSSSLLLAGVELECITQLLHVFITAAICVEY